MKTFNELRNYLFSIPNIHDGGCGISALFMYKWVKQNMPAADVRFVYLYHSCSEAYTHNDSILKNNSAENPTSCSHACIVLGDEYMDCEKLVRPGDFTFVHNIDNEEFILKSLRNRSKWNDWFSRDLYLPIMEQVIGIKLNI